MRWPSAWLACPYWICSSACCRRGNSGAAKTISRRIDRHGANIGAIPVLEPVMTTSSASSAWKNSSPVQCAARVPLIAMSAEAVGPRSPDRIMARRIKDGAQ
jgi:hypothetical protein